MVKQWEYDQKTMTWCEEFRQNVYGFALMLWDGLGFFGTDHMKLGRLKGERVNFITPFKSPSTILISLFGISLMLYIILKEGSNLGK